MRKDKTKAWKDEEEEETAGDSDVASRVSSLAVLSDMMLACSCAPDM